MRQRRRREWLHLKLHGVANRSLSMLPDENPSRKGLKHIVEARKWGGFEDMYPLQLQLEEAFVPVAPSGAGVDTIQNQESNSGKSAPMYRTCMGAQMQIRVVCFHTSNVSIGPFPKLKFCLAYIKATAITT